MYVSRFAFRFCPSDSLYVVAVIGFGNWNCSYCHGLVRCSLRKLRMCVHVSFLCVFLSMRRGMYVKLPLLRTIRKASIVSMHYVQAVLPCQFLKSLDMSPCNFESSFICFLTNCHDSLYALVYTLMSCTLLFRMYFLYSKSMLIPPIDILGGVVLRRLVLSFVLDIIVSSARHKS